VGLFGSSGVNSQNLVCLKNILFDEIDESKAFNQLLLMNVNDTNVEKVFDILFIVFKRMLEQINGYDHDLVSLFKQIWSSIVGNDLLRVLFLLSDLSLLNVDQIKRLQSLDVHYHGYDTGDSILKLLSSKGKIEMKAWYTETIKYDCPHGKDSLVRYFKFYPTFASILPIDSKFLVSIELCQRSTVYLFYCVLNSVLEMSLTKQPLQSKAAEKYFGICFVNDRNQPQSVEYQSQDYVGYMDPLHEKFLSVYKNISIEVYAAEFDAVDIKNIVSRDAHIINLMFLLSDFHWLEMVKKRGSQSSGGSQFIELLFLQSLKLGKLELFFSTFKLISISDECSNRDYLDDLCERKLKEFSWIVPALVTAITSCHLSMDSTTCQIISLILRIIFFQSARNVCNLTDVVRLFKVMYMI